MEKTIICNYWKKGICKFMIKPEKCNFAHGSDDIRTITINCRYGSFCHNVDCMFFHGSISTTRQMVYEIPLIIKKSKKSKKDINKNIFTQRGNSEKIKILEENKKTVNSLSSILKNISDISDNLDNYGNRTNNIINTEYKDLNSIIKELEIENQMLKNEIENLKEYHTKNSMVENKKINNKKMDILYNKYISIYNIFKKFDNNYKIIKEKIKQYTNDNNIYKVKSRATKVYNFCNNLKCGIINEYLPITKIIKMSF